MIFWPLRQTCKQPHEKCVWILKCMCENLSKSRGHRGHNRRKSGSSQLGLDETAGPNLWSPPPLTSGRFLLAIVCFLGFKGASTTEVILRPFLLAMSVLCWGIPRWIDQGVTPPQFWFGHYFVYRVVSALKSMMPSRDLKGQRFSIYSLGHFC